MAHAQSPAVTVAVQGGAGSETGMLEPFSIVFDGDGTMYGVTFTKQNQVFKVTPDGKYSVIAGVKSASSQKVSLENVGDGGPAMEAHFNGMHDLCLTTANDGLKTNGLKSGGKTPLLYLADTFNHRIRCLDLTTNVVTTVAGTGKAGYNGDGKPATEKQLNSPICFSDMPGKGGGYLITDLGNNRLRALTISGEKDSAIETIAGNGQKGKIKEGSNAEQSPFNGIRAATGNAEHLWIALREGNSLVEDWKGTLKTAVNLAGKAGYSDGAAEGAISAQLNGPKYLALDEQGNVIICDTENHVIRRYLPKEKKIELLVGIPGKAGSTIGANGLETQLKRPHGTRIFNGSLYIADSENDRILKLPYPAKK